jgi:hypothetical protein
MDPGFIISELTKNRMVFQDIFESAGVEFRRWKPSPVKMVSAGNSLPFI